MLNPQIETSALRAGALPADALAVASMIGTGMEKIWEIDFLTPKCLVIIASIRTRFPREEDQP